MAWLCFSRASPQKRLPNPLQGSKGGWHERRNLHGVGLPVHNIGGSGGRRKGLSWGPCFPPIEKNDGWGSLAVEASALAKDGPASLRLAPYLPAPYLPMSPPRTCPRCSHPILQNFRRMGWQ